jgi:hypothetical protein
VADPTPAPGQGKTITAKIPGDLSPQTATEPARTGDLYFRPVPIGRRNAPK